MPETTSWLQISAGQCPAECEWVVARLTPLIIQELVSKKLLVEELDRSPGEHAGDAKSILLRVSGDDTTSAIQGWLGTIQWIGTSPYRSHHKRKNWFVSVASFAEPKATAWDAAEITIEAMRASGPGGQHVNRTESAIRATHVPTGLSTMAQEERSQHMNRRLALARLAMLLEERSTSEHKQAEDARWRQHASLIRGNPTRAYRGEKWVREL